MTPKAISDVNRSERLRLADALDRLNVSESDFDLVVKMLREDDALIARLRVDAERADRYLKLLRDWTGCEPEDLDAATAPKQVAYSSGRAEEEDHERSRS